MPTQIKLKHGRIIDVSTSAIVIINPNKSIHKFRLFPERDIPDYDPELSRAKPPTTKKSKIDHKLKISGQIKDEITYDETNHIISGEFYGMQSIRIAEWSTKLSPYHSLFSFNLDTEEIEEEIMGEKLKIAAPGQEEKKSAPKKEKRALVNLFGKKSNKTEEQEMSYLTVDSMPKTKILGKD